VLILSPRAVERLESWTPPWPLPKIFRLTKNGKLNEGIFKGATINTPSLLCVADYLDALGWVESLGGVDATIERCRQNLSVIESFVSANPWIGFLAESKRFRSCTSVCLTIDLAENQIQNMINMLGQENVAHDIGAYRDAPAGLRIWCGATIEKSDLELLMPWLDWAYQQAKEQG